MNQEPEQNYDDLRQEDAACSKAYGRIAWWEMTLCRLPTVKLDVTTYSSTFDSQAVAMGNLWSATFPPKTKFTANDVPDQTGRIAIVTGGNSGIGEETVKALLAHNAKVYMASRSESKARESIARLKKETGKEAIFLKLDLSDLKAVKSAAEEFLSKETHLHMLYNNGGVMAPPIEQLTAQGYDLSFGTNVLGHFYFTKLLLPALLRGAKSSSDGKARVINTASIGHMWAGMDFNTFKDGPARRKTKKLDLYHQSKFGNIVFSNQLAKLYGDQGIISTSLHPGVIKSNLMQNQPAWVRPFAAPFLSPAPLGAVTQLWAGTSPETLGYNGKFLMAFARLWEASPATSDEKQAEELWKWMEEQVKDI